eukprot:scaffold19838_cov130-Skeletonema_dohrnii-CCMP3373.AAC.1
MYEPSSKEFVLGMGRRSSYAAVKDVQILILSSTEECALDMGQRSSDAVVKNATTMSSKEECVLNMECRSSYEGAKDAQIAGGGVCKRHGPTHSQTVQYISKSYKRWQGICNSNPDWDSGDGEKKKEGNASGKVTYSVKKL